MRRARRLSARGRVLLACVLVATLAPACPNDDGPTWRPVLGDLDGAILSLWGPSTEELFAVGGTLNPDGGEDLILRSDGTSWYRMEADAPTLWWVHGFAADDVWAVGEHGTILHFDGAAWSVVQTGGAYTLYGVWGADPGELWAVGGAVTGGLPGVLRHYDGSAWSDVTGVGLEGELLFKVWGTARDSAWIVGTRGAMLRFDGVTWSRVDSGTTDRLLTVRGRGPTELYAVGGVAEPVLLRGDGTSWTALDTRAAGGLMGVWTAPGQPVLAVGFSGIVVTGDDDDWQPAPYVTSDCLHAAWGDGRGTLLAGGGGLLGTSPSRGILLGRGPVAEGVVQPWPGP